MYLYYCVQTICANICSICLHNSHQKCSVSRALVCYGKNFGPRGYGYGQGGGALQSDTYENK